MASSYSSLMTSTSDNRVSRDFLQQSNPDADAETVTSSQDADRTSPDTQDMKAGGDAAPALDSGSADIDSKPYFGCQDGEDLVHEYRSVRQNQMDSRFQELLVKDGGQQTSVAEKSMSPSEMSSSSAHVRQVKNMISELELI